MSASDTFRAADTLYEKAMHESRAETALSASRVEKLKAVAALERGGMVEQAATLLAEVVREQERSGVRAVG